MKFMQKILNTLNMENWNKENKWTVEENHILNTFQTKIECANNLINKARNAPNREELHKCINEIERLFAEFRESETAYGKHYESIQKQKENNLKITFDDVKAYNNKPFDLNKPFISDEHFTAIELSGQNLQLAYKYLDEINSLLFPHKYLYEDATFPSKISTECILNRELPVSHIRLMPYTATMRKSKYPICLWLSYSGYYGTEYLYAIYFDKEGKLGQAELSLHGKDGIGISYETKVRRNESGLYVLRISKTLYSPPYGTTTIYHYEERKIIINNEYDLERYAAECNAYAIKEQRKEQSANKEEL